MVYVLEFPLLDGMTDMPDILEGKTKPPGVKMLPHVNPIAIFATKLGKKSQKYKMKVVAIQVDSKKGNLALRFLFEQFNILFIRYNNFQRCLFFKNIHRIAY